jgi:hypothetical protein
MHTIKVVHIIFIFQADVFKITNLINFEKTFKMQIRTTQQLNTKKLCFISVRERRKSAISKENFKITFRL